MSGVTSKIPGWVERMLIPTIEAKVRMIVAEEFVHFEKVMDAKFETVNARIDAVNTKVDSLEKRFPAVQEIAEIKARLNSIERER
jgi:tetrahydromethanopterin S-methyltransferase subunit G